MLILHAKTCRYDTDNVTLGFKFGPEMLRGPLIRARSMRSANHVGEG